MQAGLAEVPLQFVPFVGHSREQSAKHDELGRHAFGDDFAGKRRKHVRALVARPTVVPKDDRGGG